MAQNYPPTPPSGPQATGASNGLALGGMICGIIGAVVAFLIPIVGLLLGLVAVGLSIPARSRAAASGVGRGQATAGLVLGIAAIALSVAAYFFYLNRINDILGQ